MWFDLFIEEHGVIRRAINALLISASSSYMLSERDSIEQVLPLYKEFKNIFIDSCHHKKEEALADLLVSHGYKLSRDFTSLHSIVRDRFKDLMAAYVAGDRGEVLASKAAVYYEAMEDHIEDEERAIFTEILNAMSKTGISDHEIEYVLKEIEAALGEEIHERMIELVGEMENKLSSNLMRNRAVAMNVITIKPYERHVLIKKTIQEMKVEGAYRLILINDHEPVPLYYELLHTEACFDESLFKSKQLSSRIWVSLIVLKKECK
ncbi:MAG TPA: hemerythrin domain-containing protein [Sulfolobales archaeon]|nr:hemerythrin domain-containing protein [Sulfolobales archaeon]